MLTFDLRTINSAFSFIQNLINTSRRDFYVEYTDNCNSDFEVFWRKYIGIISHTDISDLRIMAFHITGSIDDCAEIKSKGLMNLQMLVSKDTVLSRMFREYSLSFDIDNRLMKYNDKVISIDYLKNKDFDELTQPEQAIDGIAHRLFYDFCANGFLYCENPYSYGTNIHLRPEFIMKLIDLFPELNIMEDEWIEKHVSYRIDFISYIYQIHRFTFQLDDYDDPPYEDWDDLPDELRILKWMLSHAIDRVFDALNQIFIYVRDDTIIPPEQIISYTKID